MDNMLVVYIRVLMVLWSIMRGKYFYKGGNEGWGEKSL